MEVGHAALRLLLVGAIFGLIGFFSALVFDVREEVVGLVVGVAAGMAYIVLEVGQGRALSK